MSNFMFDGLHQGLGKVLDLRMAQHTLTATNLANADTPGFKAKFIPFDRILSDVVDEGTHMKLRTTRQGHLPGLDVDPSDPTVEEIEAPSWAADGNSVVAEREAVRLKQNSTIYTGVSRGLSKRLALMKFAASDGTR